MATLYRHPRGTRAALNALAAADGLTPNVVYQITDEDRLAVATSVSTYQTFLKEGEGSGGSQSIIPIWAEENGGLAANAYEWSWGNGATGSDIGIPIPVACELFAVSFNADTFGTSVQMRTQGDGTVLHTSSFTANNQVDTLETPVPVPAGTRLDFRTGSLVGTTTDARVCAWLRTT